MKNQKGHFMIESIVATSLVVVGLVGLLGFLIRGFQFQQDFYNKFIATNLAAEGIEIIKNIIDMNIASTSPNVDWLNGLSDGDYLVTYNSPNVSPYDSNNPSYLKNDNGFYQYDNGTTTLFFRYINIEKISNLEVKVKSFVSWHWRGRTSTIHIEDRFYKWR